MEKGEIRINTENIFPIIKKAVYSDHEIFLRELVSNAVDAISKRRMASMAGDCDNCEEPQVKITIDREKNILKISDNGIGMDEPNSVFDPFFTTKAHGKGVGLGLSISYDLAMKFGGDLKAHNIKPYGSEFTLTLRNG